jgi:3-deoxy-D-manno-octulosonic-acid transferase
MTRVAPRAAIIMETELWPNLFHACAEGGIPLILANARLSARSAAGYRRFSGLAARTLGCVTAVAAQGEADGRRFVELGVPDERIHVTGSVKFDFTVPDTLPQAAAALRTRCGDRPVWVAGSTHAGEEAQVLEAHGAIRRRFADALLILVPRHPERFGEVARLAGRLGLTVARRSLGESPAAAAVYLGDTMGELLQLYATADVAFVGGSLVPVGGHNLIEPAALGRPVVTGPHLHNFVRIAELLDTAGALLTVDSSEALAEGVVALFDDADRRAVAGSAGQEVVARNRGALDRLEALVAEALEGGRAVAA